jgi:hypothetical protein
MPPTNLTELISFYLCLFSLFWAFPKLWYSRNLKERFERASNHVLESGRGTQKTPARRASQALTNSDSTNKRGVSFRRHPCKHRGNFPLFSRSWRVSVRKDATRIRITRGRSLQTMVSEKSDHLIGGASRLPEIDLGVAVEMWGLEGGMRVRTRKPARQGVMESIQ